ncbi:cell cycle regulator of non-homologous end joining isoform X2 [Sapajus apella]|uniref:Cell cycle regulator of non-homologous end joining isoform X2 n=1 Tax=Sapajus apella TaxID=9515 RepID=A0A6J3HNX8_SAPAP|nr:cell cycle regulator of non-homologous end joining isoform X2 [Sapajus apella]
MGCGSHKRPEFASGLRSGSYEGAREPEQGTLRAGKPVARLPATRTVYCMNEAEIVDVALGILIESRKQEKPCEQPALAGTDNPQPSPPCSVSPHTSSGSSSEEEDSGKQVPAPGLSPSQRPGSSNSPSSRSPEEEEEEEDVLKYVREIFFS